MRAEFKMTEQQFADLMDACKPTPAIWGSGGAQLVSTPQENANRAWQKLADELGFVWDTVSPVPGKGQLWFSAEEREVSVPQLAGDAVDARRYRFLRDSAVNVEGSPWIVTGTAWNDTTPILGSDLDRAVDVSMRADELSQQLEMPMAQARDLAESELQQ
jgi:hypothetical protein